MGLPDPSQRCFRIGYMCERGCTARSLAECPRRNEPPPPHVFCSHCGARNACHALYCVACEALLPAKADRDCAQDDPRDYVKPPPGSSPEIEDARRFGTGFTREAIRRGESPG